MENNVDTNRTYAPSDDVVVRVIEGELIIVPLVSGIGNIEDELFTLNKTGRAIWERLDGKKSLKDLARELSTEYEAPEGEIERDLTGLVQELLKRRMLVDVSDS